MLSQTVEYALRAVVTLAYRHGEPLTGRQIAEVTRVPEPYLLKLMQQLVRADLVHSQRGRGGGFSLTRPPACVTIWDVVEAVDPIRRIRSCPLGIKGHTTLCPLHRRLDHSIQITEEAYRSTTLTDITQECGETSPLCTTTPVVALGGLDATPSRAPQRSAGNATEKRTKATRKKS